MKLEDKIDKFINEDYNDIILEKAFQQGYNNLIKLEETVQEEESLEPVNESLTVSVIISSILGMPGLVKLITKGIGFLYKKLKKTFGGKEESYVEDKLISFCDKWHHMYVNVLHNILKLSGVFKKVKIVDEEKQKKATEVVFYSIIFGFAINAGIATAEGIIHLIKSGGLHHLGITGLEGVMTAIKSKEVVKFINQIKS